MDQSTGKQNTHASATASAPRNYACSLPLTFGYCTPLWPLFIHSCLATTMRCTEITTMHGEKKKV